MDKRIIFLMLLLLLFGCGGSGDDITPIVAKNNNNIAPVLVEAFVVSSGFRPTPVQPACEGGCEEVPHWYIGENSSTVLLYEDLEGDVNLLTVTIFIYDGVLGDNEEDDFYNIYLLYINEDWFPVPDGRNIFRIVAPPGEGLFVVDGDPGLYEVEYKVTDTRGRNSNKITNLVEFKELVN